MNLLIINIAGLAVIALIIYWFWIYKPKDVQAKDQDIITIMVEDGVYQPSRISVPADTEISLEFKRKDKTPCEEIVIFPELNISESLPINKAKTIKLKKLEKVNYQFHCQMQMYKGELHVE